MKDSKHDLRVKKTLNLIKNAFMTLILEEPYQDIRIVQIAERAQVNRKTFYLHYASIEDVMSDIEHDFVNEISTDISTLAPDDLKGAILIYYRFLDTEDRATQKLLYGRDYTSFFRNFSDDVLSLDFFMRYYTGSVNDSIIRGYFDGVTGIFVRWHDSHNGGIEIEELAETAACLVLDGISAVSQ